MSMETMATSMMIPWLHFTGGDNLYFQFWRPTSKGAIAGACIALICLALLERFVAASRSLMEARWRHRVMTLTTSKQDIPPAEIPLQCSDKAEKSSDVAQLPQNPLSSYGYQSQSSPRLIAPFVLAHDIPRGVMHAVQALLGYTLMLAVMTFQAAYIISIILGLGIGEALFGRMSY